VEGELAPGERIQDSALAVTLGVSRMPVREALLRLQSEGLVETAPNRWIRVTPVSAEQGEELYPLIWALEELALRLGARAITAADLDAMGHANERLRKAIDAGRGRAAYEADTSFHAVFVEASGNAELVRILADLKLRLRRLEVAYFAGNLKAAESVLEHETVLEALRASDTPAAAAGVEANWRRSLERYRRQLVAGGHQATTAVAGAL
jgi:DNA-binding GntR family transcriptional regulator